MELVHPNSPPSVHPALTPRKGISPPLLLNQIRNTAPFLFHPAFKPGPKEPHLAWLRRLDGTLAESPFRATLMDDVDFFHLNLAAHHATVATFVPTDVDNAIRFKLWGPTLPIETICGMAQLVTESLDWSFLSVSTRSVVSPLSGERISGHHGEWFSTAVAAYGALRRRAPEAAAEMGERILSEVEREAHVYRDLRNAGDGIGLLKAATVIAHNLGDLDRVIDMWTFPDDEALKKAVYKAGHATPVGSRLSHVAKDLAQAGELNKAYMAVENHRHFVLRSPRSLRRSAELLLPIAPFLDEWGERVGRHPELEAAEVGEIAEALVDGWERLTEAAKAGTGPGPVGYARALAGIEQSFPGGLEGLSREMPSRNARKLKTGPLRALASVARHRFEGHWNTAALKFAR